MKEIPPQKHGEQCLHVEHFYLHDIHPTRSPLRILSSPLSRPLLRNRLVMAKDTIRIPRILQTNQPRQLLRSKRPRRILIPMRIADINLRLSQPTRLLKLGPQIHRQLIRIRACRTCRTARESHFEHDLRVDVSPGVSGVIVRDGENGFGGEILDFQDGSLRFGVLGIHGAVSAEGVDEGGRVKSVDAGREAGVGFALGTHRGIETEAGGLDEVVPGEGVHDLCGGFEVEEGLDEGHECSHGPWVDGVENDDFLFRVRSRFSNLEYGKDEKSDLQYRRLRYKQRS